MFRSKFTCQFRAFRPQSALGRTPLVAVALLSASMLAGCASTGGEELAGMTSTPKPFVPLQKDAAPLDRAIQYWSQAFAQNPGNEKAAVAYARNLRAKGQKEKALQVLQRASMANSNSRAIASEYARVAIDLGQVEFGQKLLKRASNPAKPDWRLISAQGAALAKRGKHREAQGYFLRALQMKPAHPPLLNNLALAYALNGDIDDAERLLRQAAAKGQKIGKIRQNLALVLGLQGKFGESQKVAQAVQLTEGRARSNTEFLKRWVKASPRTAPQAAIPDVQTASLRGTAEPTKLTPWDTTTQTADASWVTEVADGH